MALNSTRINKIGNDASVPAPAIAPGSHTTYPPGDASAGDSLAA